MNKKQKKRLIRIIVALAIFALMETLHILGVFESLPYGIWVEFVAFLVPYLIAGYDVLAKAWHGITHRQPFDENLLMAIATIGAFALVLFPDTEPHMAEGAAVMLFYQVGELFESYAVGKTRKSISDMMDIAPDYANVMTDDGTLQQVDPYEVPVGSTIVCKPGERIPLDGVVVEGRSQVDTSALTGESIPRVVQPDEPVTSGCVNLTGMLTVRTTSAYEQSTVQRILELVENASEKKARAENFITRFARIYTPVVVGLALVIALLSPLLGYSISQSVESALIFLVVSCPCALVISVPLSFFGGIGAASRTGILVKGSTYLETLSKVNTIAFDKTGTLTNGTFSVVAVHAHGSVDAEHLLSYAAHAEVYSNHPIALSVVQSYSGVIDRSHVEQVEEHSGRGVEATVDTRRVLVGNDKLMREADINFDECHLVGTILHVALDDEYLGHIVIADMMKDDAQQAIDDLHAAGVQRVVMLTGDHNHVARAVANQLGVDEVRAQLLPQDKVAAVESLLEEAAASNGKVAFVGDGINDAPVLMRADIGIAMGAMGSDAAIEAADVVLMDDKPSRIAQAIRIARKTLRIVKQNIVFALAVKIVIMVLALPMIGLSSMWLAVFGDVGVSVLAILNAMRCLRTK